MNKQAIDLFIQDCDAVLSDHIADLRPLKNSTIAISGGTGFVGTWLAGLLRQLNENHNFNTQVTLIGRNRKRFKETRPHLADHKYISVMEDDIRRVTDLPKTTNWLIHAAATPDNRFHASHPLETMSVIADGTRTVLQLAERLSDLKALLNLSSGLVYGAQPMDVSGISESYQGIVGFGSVSNAYAEAKRYAETLCGAARSQSHTPIITARPFAFLGPYQALDRPWAANNFMYDALGGHPIRVLGNGQSVRSYLYGSDMALWLLMMLVKAPSGETYNVGSSHSVTLAEMAKLVADQAATKLEIKVGVSANHRHVSRFVPDVSHATKTLGVKVSVDLKTAIQRTMAWNRSMMAG